MEGLRKKLPEGAFQSAIYALGIFPLLRTIPRRAAGRRWKERLQRWEQRLERWEQHFFKHWVKHPHPTMGYDWLTLAGWACDLRDVLAGLRDVLGPRSDEMWSRHLRRGPGFKDARFQPFLNKADYAREPAIAVCSASVMPRPPLSRLRTSRCLAGPDRPRAKGPSMGAAIGVLHVLYHCFLSIDAEHRSDLSLPKIARPDALKSLRLFFIDFMSDRYCNDLVAELTTVAFDRDVGPETVQRRRRMRAA